MRLTIPITFALAVLACSEAPEGTGGSSTTDLTTTGLTTTEPTTTAPTTTSTTEPEELCVAGEVGPCYSGPPGTVDIGLCVAGMATCLPDGSGFGPCEGEITPQAEDCEASPDENCDGLAVCPFGASLWSRQFGDAQADYVNGLAVGSDDSVAIVGHYYGNFEFDRGVILPDGEAFDSYVSMLNTAGDHLWTLPIEGVGAPENSRALAAAVCIDGAGAIYVSGTFDSTIAFGGASLENNKPVPGAFLAKLGPDGEYLWAKGFAPDDDDNDERIGATLWHLACDPAGGVATAGIVSSAKQIDLGGGPLWGYGPPGIYGDALVAGFDGDGKHLWSRRFRRPAQGAQALAHNTKGDVAICGQLAFGDTIDFGGGPRMGLPRDLFIAQFDSKGAHLWSETWGGDGSSITCGALAFDAQDALLVAGTFEGEFNLGGANLKTQDMVDSSFTSDIFLAKFAGGVHQWSLAAGLAVDGIFFPTGLATDSSDAIYLYGQYADAAPSGIGLPLPASNGTALVLAKYTSDGQPLSAGAYDSIGENYSGGIAINSEDHVLLGGYFTSTIDFGSGSHAEAGTGDAFVAKVQIK